MEISQTAVDHLESLLGPETYCGIDLSVTRYPCHQGKFTVVYEVWAAIEAGEHETEKMRITGKGEDLATAMQTFENKLFDIKCQTKGVQNDIG